MSNVTPIRPEAAPPSESGPDLLESAARLMRAAVALYGESHEPQGVELRDVGEVLATAQSRLEHWLKASRGSEGDSLPAAYNALDGITVVRALIEADISPRNRYTISPIAAVLRLAARDLEGITEPEETEEAAS